MDCELIVPPNPLTATGLATPYHGFNGNNLQLAGARPGTLARAKCVGGLADSLRSLTGG